MPEYQVVIKKKAQRNLKKIDKRYRGRIYVALIELKREPYLGKPLTGVLRGKFSLRVWPYRIVYEVFRNKLVVYVVAIEHRQGVYK